MKKRIKKFLYSSLIAFVSMEISFNTEARLPKYMAQRAAELLIEKSGLQLKSTTLIFVEQDVDYDMFTSFENPLLLQVRQN